jgi:hypothetical protein
MKQELSRLACGGIQGVNLNRCEFGVSEFPGFCNDTREKSYGWQERQDFSLPPAGRARIVIN